jgi:integrase
VTARNKKDAKKLKPTSIAYYEQRLDALLESWPGEPGIGKQKWSDYRTNHPGASWADFKRNTWTKYRLAQIEISKLSESACKRWADEVRQEWSATSFNHTLGVFRNVIEFGIKVGARYDNPAKVVMRESEMEKSLELPDADKFGAFVAEIENGGSGFSKSCADLVRFMAYGGWRKGEAAFVIWGDCDFDRNQITVRGHPETGLKNPHAFGQCPVKSEIGVRNGRRMRHRRNKVGNHRLGLLDAGEKLFLLGEAVAALMGLMLIQFIRSIFRCGGTKNSYPSLSFFRGALLGNTA